MYEPKDLIPKSARRFLATPQLRGPEESKQRSMMVIALTLLLVALVFVLYRDRDFWFPETQEAEQQIPSAPATTAAQPSVLPKTTLADAKSKQRASKTAKQNPEDSAAASSTPPAAAISRTVLPPLEVEVVAGNVHRAIRDGGNSVRVDLQPGSPPQTVSAPPMADATETGASVTSAAAERVKVTGDMAEVVSHPAKPDYPLLARQMKVQGSVILQVLIGRDGLIQDLRVISGPPILANAAQEAIKQWHFKPHYEGADAVETQARITVNFTISTN
jgi:TonB family protein